jgi:hypothetical protein
MHLMHTDPRRMLLAAIAALVLALTTAMLFSDLSTLSISSTDGAAPIDTQTTLTSDSPAWVTGPLTSPLVELRAPAAPTP